MSCHRVQYKEVPAGTRPAQAKQCQKVLTGWSSLGPSASERCLEKLGCGPDDSEFFLDMHLLTFCLTNARSSKIWVDV